MTITLSESEAFFIILFIVGMINIVVNALILEYAATIKKQQQREEKKRLNN